jgi:A/G-specific adenine glycosylase
VRRNSKPSRTTEARIGTRLLRWYDRHGRKDLPWKTGDAYHVWLSEIMLQQTQVGTVIPYFQRFVARFPTIRSLARADINAVLHLWSGLGYYARARNLHRAAQILMRDYGGRMPPDFEAVVSLPGIGRSTAGAILAQAYGQRHPILDGNVKRVFARYHAIAEPLQGSAVERRLWELAEYHTPRARVADYTQAIMDIGATLCRRTRPGCVRCPLRRGCAAHAEGRPETYPRPKPRKTVPVRAVRMLLIRDEAGRILLQRRPPAGIWGGLWGLPECTTRDIRAWCRDTLGLEIETDKRWPTLRHSFSHFRLDIHPIPAQLVNGGARGISEPAPSRQRLTRVRDDEPPATGEAEFSQTFGGCLRRTGVPRTARPGPARGAGRVAPLLGRAGAYTGKRVAPGTAGTVMESADLVWYNCRKPDERGLAAPVRRLLEQLRDSEWLEW